MRNDPDLDLIHKSSSRHRERVLASTRCGCFYCEAIFLPAEIFDWTHEGPGGVERSVTALCPHCGIDAVLPDEVPGAELTVDLLRAMRTRWFGANADVAQRAVAVPQTSA